MNRTSVYTVDTPFRDPIDLIRFRFGSKNSGPKVAIIAGLHGNEVGGVCAANQLIRWLHEQEVTGCIDIFPVVNPVGLDQTSKVNPLDHRDINRCFPGNPNGTASERIAAALFQEIEEADWVVCVHTGAAHVRDITQVRCHPEHVETAFKMGAPLVWVQEKLDGNVSLARQCHLRGQSVLYCTGGSGNSVDPIQVTELHRVLQEFLHHLGCAQSAFFVEGPETLILHGPLTEIRTGKGGFLLPLRSVGDVLQKGDPIATIQGVLGGELKEMIEAPFNCKLASIRVNPIVHAQELVAKILPVI